MSECYFQRPPTTIIARSSYFTDFAPDSSITMTGLGELARFYSFLVKLICVIVLGLLFEAVSAKVSYLCQTVPCYRRSYQASTLLHHAYSNMNYLKPAQVTHSIIDSHCRPSVHSPSC